MAGVVCSRAVLGKPPPFAPLRARRSVGARWEQKEKARAGEPPRRATAGCSFATRRGSPARDTLEPRRGAMQGSSAARTTRMGDVRWHATAPTPSMHSLHAFYRHDVIRRERRRRTVFGENDRRLGRTIARNPRMRLPASGRQRGTRPRLRTDPLAQTPRRLQPLAASAVPAHDGASGQLAVLDRRGGLGSHTPRTGNGNPAGAGRSTGWVREWGVLPGARGGPTIMLPSRPARASRRRRGCPPRGPRSRRGC